MLKQLLVFSLALLVFFSLCVGNETEPVKETTSSTEVVVSTTEAPLPEETTTTTEPPVIEEIPLSDLQIEACNAADAGGTCVSKLPDLGLVDPEECCEYLDKCC